MMLTICMDLFGDAITDMSCPRLIPLYIRLSAEQNSRFPRFKCPSFRSRVSSLTSLHYLWGRLHGLAVACWTTDYYHPCSNPGVGISEGCFVLHFVSLHLEVAWPIQLTLCTKVAVKHQSSSSSLPLEVARPIQPTICTEVAVKHQSSSSVTLVIKVMIFRVKHGTHRIDNFMFYLTITT